MHGVSECPKLHICFQRLSQEGVIVKPNHGRIELPKRPSVAHLSKTNYRSDAEHVKKRYKKNEPEPNERHSI